MGKLYKSPLFQAATVMPLKSLLAAFYAVISSSKFHLCVFTYIYYDVLICSPEYSCMLLMSGQLY